MCRCGYLAIDGGRVQRIRTCLDLPGDPEARYRDFVDLSLVTSTFSRRGLAVEAFCTEVALTLTGPDGRVTSAEPGDWVVFEPEGGHTGWRSSEFLQVHAVA